MWITAGCVCVETATSVPDLRWSLVPDVNVLLDPSVVILWLLVDDLWPLPSGCCGWLRSGVYRQMMSVSGVHSTLVEGSCCSTYVVSPIAVPWCNNDVKCHNRDLVGSHLIPLTLPSLCFVYTLVKFKSSTLCVTQTLVLCSPGTS